MGVVDNKVALVTGGGSGIGQATALRLAEEGARLVVADITIDGGEKTVAQIKAAGGEAIFVRTDVTKEADCAALVAAALKQYGKLDIAFNNAGIVGYPLLTADYGLANWQRVIDVNLTGVFNCMTHEIQAMKQAGGGSIINTASIMGLRGAVGGAAYCAAKHGVVGLTRAAALEYGRKNIRINAVCPGYVETPMTVGEDSIFPANKLEAGLDRAPIRRMATPAEIGEAVVWLASDKASYVTGISIPVDGGVMAG